MKNGTIRFIPLQSDLCLNKQKVDITDFKGWQKCNSAVYGDCLSPLYKKSDTHHDIFIGDDTYDFTSGKLYKNGVEVLSGVGSKKLKKTKIQENYSSIKLTDDNLLTWCKETGSNTIRVSLAGETASNITISNCTRILATKCFGDSTQEIYGCVVWYLHTNGKSGYFVIWLNGETTNTSYGTGDPTLYTNFNVISPLIQAAVVDEGTVVVSLFGNSGANISETQVKNFVIKDNDIYDDPTIIDSTNYPVRYNTIKQNIEAQVDMFSTLCHWVGRDYDSTNDYPGSPCVTVDYYKQQIVIHIGGDYTYDVPLTATLFYYNKSGTKVYTNYTFTIPAHSDNVTKTMEAWSAWRGLRETDDYNTLIGYKYLVDGTEVNAFSSTDVFLPPQINAQNNHFTTGVEISYATTTDIDNPRSAGETVTQTVTVPTSSSEKYYFLRTYYKILNNSNMLRSSSTDDIDDIYAYIMNNERTYFNKPSSANSTSSSYPRDKSIWGNPSWLVSGNYFANPNTYKTKYYQTTEYAYYKFARYIKQAYTEQALKECDCILDDGRFYCIGAITTDTENPLPTKLFALAGSFVSFDTTQNRINYYSIATFDITYQEESGNIYPKYYAGMSISLQDKYLRILYKFKKNKETDEIIYFGVDSTSVKTSEGKNIFLYPGVQDGSDTNLQGSCLNAYGWRLLFNNNMIANVACFENENYIGTILADWLTIDTDFHTTFNAQKLYYRDTNNQIWLIEKVDMGEEWQYRLIENRFIVLNTTNYFNCYDTQTGLKRHWASDYNNRVMYGYGFSQYAVNDTFKKLLEGELFRGLLISGQNANYERTKDPITSIELGAILYARCIIDSPTFYSCDTPYGALEGIDLYRADGDSTSALYVYSIQNGLKYIDTDLTNPFAIYPISDTGDVRYNPNLFTRFITSYNNKDMVISDDIAYKLLYFNNVIPIMSYYLLDGVESLENAFVLQSSYYGVAKTRLYQMNYSNGVGVEVVCDITNMEYLGALPTQALFWSAQNRAIYSFTGSCIMQLSQYANDLTGIYGKWYNPATQELFLDTNIGILVFSDLGTYCLEWQQETQAQTVKDIFFFGDYFIVNLIGDTTNSTYYSYNNKEGYESNKVYFVTKYYGNGLVPITVNNIYIRLYNQGVENAAGFIKMKGYTITDKGTSTDTKEVLIGGEDNPQANPPTVAGEAWDTSTGTMLVKYTPQYNRGLGFALEVETTFPIIDIKFDYVENGTIESQIAHINI